MKELFNSIFTEKIKLTIFLCCLVYLLLIYANLWETGEEILDTGQYGQSTYLKGPYRGIEYSINYVGSFIFILSVLIVSLSILIPMGRFLLHSIENIYENLKKKETLDLDEELTESTNDSTKKIDTLPTINYNPNIKHNKLYNK